MTLMSVNLDENVDRNKVPTLKFDHDTMQSVFGTADLWPSWVADMDFKAAPPIVQALQQRLAHGIFGYEASSDQIPTAVSTWYHRRYHWQFDARQIISTPRTLNSLATLVSLFSDEGDGVIVQPPVFYDFKLILRAHRRRLVRNPLQLVDGQYQMDLEQLESVAADPANRLMILCNPHNPVGRIWSKAELAALAEICQRHSVFIIADEIHGDLGYRQRYTPMAGLGDAVAQQVAACISPVKSFNLSGVAGSMIVIANEERRIACTAWYDRQEINKNNVFGNAATLAAYTDGEAWLEQAIDYLHGNLELLRGYLTSEIPEVGLIEPQGGFLLWLDFRELGFDADELSNFLIHEARMATNPGHWFGREGLGFARINMACPRNVLVKAFEQLASAVHKRRSA